MSYLQITRLTYLIARSAFEAVRVEPVDMEDVNGTLDAEMMELARHFKEQQVVLRWRKGRGRGRETGHHLNCCAYVKFACFTVFYSPQ